MTPHNSAKNGDIAPSVLLPGDPLRAKFIAETYLENVVCYNNVRNMLGYTGFYRNKQVSVQGTGMGIPSISIYANELLNIYGCKNLIRIGTCGALHDTMKVRDIVLGTAACTDSAVNKQRFDGMDYAPAANFELALAAYNAAKAKNLPLKSGLIFSSDLFYKDNPDWYKKWADYGVLAVEMEAAGLYTLAAKYNARALALLTVSDHLITGKNTTPQERQTSFIGMVEIALEAAISV